MADQLPQGQYVEDEPEHLLDSVQSSQSSNTSPRRETYRARRSTFASSALPVICETQALASRDEDNEDNLPVIDPETAARLAADPRFPLEFAISNSSGRIPASTSTPAQSPATAAVPTSLSAQTPAALPTPAQALATRGRPRSKTILGEGNPLEIPLTAAEDAVARLINRINHEQAASSDVLRRRLRVPSIHEAAAPSHGHWHPISGSQVSLAAFPQCQTPTRLFTFCC